MKFLGTLIAAILAFSIPSMAHDTGDHQHGLTIENAWAPHTGKRTMSAAIYLSIKNDGKQADFLTGVSSEAANMAMLHESKEVEGIMRMEHVEALEIPAGGSASLTPGGHHIMLMQLVAPLKRGEVFPLTLSFEKAGDVAITVEITGIGGPQ